MPCSASSSSGSSNTSCSSGQSSSSCFSSSSSRRASSTCSSSYSCSSSYAPAMPDFPPEYVFMVKEPIDGMIPFFDPDECVWYLRDPKPMSSRERSKYVRDFGGATYARAMKVEGSPDVFPHYSADRGAWYFMRRMTRKELKRAMPTLLAARLAHTSHELGGSSNHPGYRHRHRHHRHRHSAGRSNRHRPSGSTEEDALEQQLYTEEIARTVKKATRDALRVHMKRNDRRSKQDKPIVVCLKGRPHPVWRSNPGKIIQDGTKEVLYLQIAKAVRSHPHLCRADKTKTKRQRKRKERQPQVYFASVDGKGGDDYSTETSTGSSTSSSSSSARAGGRPVIIAARPRKPKSREVPQPVQINLNVGDKARRHGTWERSNAQSRKRDPIRIITV